MKPIIYICVLHICIFMYFKIDMFVPDPKLVAIYSYEVCDSNGNTISSPSIDYLNLLYKISKTDAQIILSQIRNTANKYGIQGRNEASKGREGLFALPSKYDEVDGKITSRYRMYYWILNKSTIIIGGGCFKPEVLNGIRIAKYQEIIDCENAASELSKIGNHLELLCKKGEIFIEDKLIEIQEEIIKL
jgi:hypothetical protein